MDRTDMEIQLIVESIYSTILKGLMANLVKENFDIEDSITHIEEHCKKIFTNLHEYVNFRNEQIITLSKVENFPIIRARQHREKQEYLDNLNESIANTREHYIVKLLNMLEHYDNNKAIMTFNVETLQEARLLLLKDFNAYIATMSNTILTMLLT